MGDTVSQFLYSPVKQAEQDARSRNTLQKDKGPLPSHLTAKLRAGTMTDGVSFCCRYCAIDFQDMGKGKLV